jgi:hypothetical protein
MNEEKDRFGDFIRLLSGRERMSISRQRPDLIEKLQSTAGEANEASWKIPMNARDAALTSAALPLWIFPLTAARSAAEYGWIAPCWGDF